MEFSTHYLLMADHAMLQKLVMSRIKPLGLTTGQPKVLDFLQDHDGAMQKDIAKGCHIEPSSLSTILGGMERAGLLERSTRDENRRTVYVRLTDLGREQCRRFECKNLLQIPVGMVFGVFTTTCNTLAAMFPSTDNLIIRLLMCWIATVFVAIGIFFYVPADIMPLAGEGAMLAIYTLTGKPFPTVKIAFDVSMVILSLITCLIFLHGLGSVGIGTVIAALLVGIELRMVTHRFGRWRDNLLGKKLGI